MGDSTVVDSMVHDGLLDVYNHYHMGMTAENVAEKHSISREQQDRFSRWSFASQAATEAWGEGHFEAEVVPVEVPGKKRGQTTIFKMDESIRPDTSIETLSALKPAFKKDGTVTAGNAPGVNDAGAALVVMSASKAKSLGLEPLVHIRAQSRQRRRPSMDHACASYGGQKGVGKGRVGNERCRSV